MSTAQEATALGLDPDLLDRLHMALRRGKVSRAQMAEALEVTPNTVSNYTSGRTEISGPQLRIFAMRCGMPYEWLRYGIKPSDAPDGGGQNLKKKNVIDLHVPTTAAAPVLLAA
jgi:transcriptional regulator with XRE-family HTH domain